MISEFHRGDVFYAQNHNATGSEQSGKRPYVIISNESNNRFAKTVTAIPLTTQDKKTLPTHCEIYIKDTKSVVLAEQITCLEKSSFESFVKHLDDEEMQNIEKVIKVQLGLPETSKNIYIYENDNKTRKAIKKIFKAHETKPKKLSKEEKIKILTEEIRKCF